MLCICLSVFIICRILSICLFHSCFLHSCRRASHPCRTALRSLQIIAVRREGRFSGGTSVFAFMLPAQAFPSRREGVASRYFSSVRGRATGEEAGTETATGPATSRSRSRSTARRCPSTASGKCRLIKSLREHSFTPNRRANDFRLPDVEPYSRMASAYLAILRRDTARPFAVFVIPCRAYSFRLVLFQILTETFGLESELGGHGSGGEVALLQPADRIGVFNLSRRVVLPHLRPIHGLSLFVRNVSPRTDQIHVPCLQILVKALDRQSGLPGYFSGRQRCGTVQMQRFGVLCHDRRLGSMDAAAARDLAFTLLSTARLRILIRLSISSL